MVGAGAAGLAAASVLARAGVATQIVEARDRIGGRILTRDVGGALPIELGPEFIHGTPPVTLALLRASGGAAYDVGGASFVRRNGVLEPDDADDDAVRDILARGASLAEDRTVDELFADFAATGTPPATLARARRLVGGFDAADPRRASARAIAAEWMGDASADGVSMRPLSGYGPLVAHLARNLDPRMCELRLRTEVRAIARDATGVRLRVRDESGDRTLAGRATIVTIPLGVLRAPPQATGAVAFEPPLPAAHARALAALEMGPVLKVVVRFSAAFWETLDGGRFREGAFFGGGRHFPTLWTQAPLHVPYLTAWAGGPAASALADCDDRELVVRARADVATIFGLTDDAPEFVDAHVHDWQRDPYARGAYSYALVGAGDARRALAQPIDGRLFIAGEATARTAEAGTVAGALESGERAARDYLAALAS